MDRQAASCKTTRTFASFTKRLNVLTCSPGKQRALADVLPEGSAPPANCSDLGEFETEPEFQTIPLINAGTAAEKVAGFKVCI